MRNNPIVSAKPSFLPLLRELARTYQTFEHYSAAHVQRMGLTPAQFDVLATLGDTPGMNAKALADKTLITKGTLTGVVDRLHLKGLVQRQPDPTDGRGQIVQLTSKGQALFERVFPAHGEYLARAFAHLGTEDQALAMQALVSLRRAFERAATSSTS